MLSRMLLISVLGASLFLVSCSEDESEKREEFPDRLITPNLNLDVNDPCLQDIEDER